MIDGQLYWVNSAQEEQALLAAHAKSLEQEIQTLEAQDAPKAKIAKTRVKVVRIERRIEKVEDAWLDKLKQDDEEILLYFH